MIVYERNRKIKNKISMAELDKLEEQIKQMLSK